MCVLGWEGLSQSGGGGGKVALGGGGGEGGQDNFYIGHSTDVRAKWPPFSALPGVWLAPFYQQKII